MQYPSDIRSVPSNELDIDLISSLCHPIFEEARSLRPTIAWAGVFGSVSRGTQRPDSDVDILVGYSKDADFLHDVCGSINWLTDSLSDVLAREVDIVPSSDYQNYLGRCVMKSGLCRKDFKRRIYEERMQGKFGCACGKWYSQTWCVMKWVAAYDFPAYHRAVTDMHTTDRRARRTFDHYGPQNLSIQRSGEWP
jgi:predicted nucleotidyltransferase